MAQRVASNQSLIAARLHLFIHNWRIITKDPWVLIKLHTGVHHRYEKTTNPESCPKGADLQSKPTRRPLQRGRKDGHKTDNNCRTQGTGCQRLPLPVIQCPKKGRGNQTDNQPKGAEQVCRNSPLQDGRDLHAKRHPKTRRLDDQSRPERYIFYDPNGPKPEASSPLQMAGGNIHSCQLLETQIRDMPHPHDTPMNEYH